MFFRQQVESESLTFVSFLWACKRMNIGAHPENMVLIYGIVTFLAGVGVGLTARFR